ncbi:MAG: BTAD domain-containing putative transcriptional regulator [Actinomycetota bacterium]
MRHRWALLARSLYRTGRQAEALAALRRARALLRDELGVDPGPELVDVERSVLQHDPRLVDVAVPSPRPPSDACPYKGLTSYGPEDAAWFFGREDDVAECLRVLRSCPVLAVVGPSGCGKSSLVRAGVVPALRAPEAPQVITPGPDPRTRLTAAVAGLRPGAVLVVDQLEELFVAPPAVAREVLDQLARCAEAGTPLVVTLRSDHLAGLSLSPPLARLAELGVHLLAPLTGPWLRAAVERPAELAGLRLEAGLADLVVAEADDEPGALPLLSHALAETWRRREGRVLTVEGYRSAGGILGAVAQSAERLHESLTPEQRDVLRALVLRLVTEAPDSGLVAVRVPWERLGGHPGRLDVVELLARARLVTTDEVGVVLAHEAVLRAWPRLRSWLDDDVAGRRRLRHLAVAAEDWRAAGRPDSELYRGGRLEDVLVWRAGEAPDLTPVEHEFLDVAAARAEAEAAEAARRLAAEATRGRRLRLALTGTAAGLVLAVGAGGLAWQQSRVSGELASAAGVDRLVAESGSLLPTRRDLAALLAAEAYRARPDDPATRSALFRVLSDAPDFAGHTWLGDVLSAGHVLPDGRTLLAVDRAGAVRAVDLAQGRVTATYPAPDADVDGSDLAVSADGRTAVAVSWQGTRTRGGVGVLSVLDVATRTRRLPDLGLRLDAGDVAVDAGGRYVAVSGDAEGRVLLMDTATVPDLPVSQRVGGEREVPGVRSLVPGGAGSGTPDAAAGGAGTVRHTAGLAFRPDGALLVGSPHGSLFVVDPASGQVVEELTGAPALTSAAGVTTSRDGAVVVSAGPSGVVRWDPAARRPAWVSRGPQGGCTGLAATAAEVLCATGFGEVIGLDALTGTPTTTRYALQRGRVSGLALAFDGSEVVVLSDAAPVLARWRRDGQGLAARPLGVDGVPVGFDATGRLLLVREPDGDLRVVDSRTGDVVSDLPGWELAVWTRRPGLLAAWEPQGNGFVVDVAGSRPDRRLNGHLGAVPGGAAVAAAADVLVAWQGTYKDALSVWDAQTGQPVRALRRGGDSASISGDGTVLVARWADRGLIVAHDLGTGEQLATREGVANAAASPDGLVAASTSSGDLRFLDARTLTESGPPLPGTPGHVEQFAFTDDGSLLAVRTASGEVRLVDVRGRIELGRPLATAAGAEGVALDPRGSGLALTTAHGLTVWDLDPDRWAQAACRLAGRTLTGAEREAYRLEGAAACD